MFYDLTFILLLPFLFFSIWAQTRISGSFNEFSKVATKKGLTGEQVALDLLAQSGITDVTVEQISGTLTDHYDPSKKVVRLSAGVFDSDSLAAASIAAHEVGHALQHNTGYTPLTLRTGLLPIAALGSHAGLWLFSLGVIFTLFSSNPMASQVMFLGVIFFSVAVGFQLLTLPVEYNASTRALALLNDNQLLDDEEMGSAKSILSSAALTYVASAAMSLVQLFRFITTFTKTTTK